MPEKTILFAGGGTGGHLWPGIVLAQTIHAKHPEITIIFFVPGKPVDKKILATTNFPVYYNSMRGKSSRLRKMPEFLWSFIQGLWQTRCIFKKHPPTLVIGLGGYGSFSAGIFAKIKKIPLVLLESNQISGKVVRWLSNTCQAIYTQSPIPNLPPSKIRSYGIPIRMDLPIHKNFTFQADGILTILVMGGSQGSQSINQAIGKSLTALQHLSQKLRFIHICGENSADMEKIYSQNGFSAEVYAFYSNMAELYKKTDIIVCRSGGSTLAEITAIGLPSILIPLPTSSENHQEHNALWVQKAGAGIVLAEIELYQKLAETLQNFYFNPQKLWMMAQNAIQISKPYAGDTIAEDLEKWLA